jgi:DNA helicase IV
MRCRLAELAYVRVAQRGLEGAVALVPVTIVKGLEIDSVVVVEPAVIEREHGVRALYVALSRATQSMTVLHAEALPTSMA